MANQNNLLSANPLNDPNYDYTTILPFRIRNLLDVDELSTDVTPELAVPGLARDVGNAAVRMGQTVRGHRPVDAGQTFIDMLEVAPAGLLAGRLAPKGATLGVFAGPRAQTANVGMYHIAQDMAEKGASREDIWQKTGWFKDVEGKWKFEIDDSGTELKPKWDDFAFNEPSKGSWTKPHTEAKRAHGASTGYEPKREPIKGSVDGLLQHQALLEAYPELKDVTVSLLPSGRESGSLTRGSIEASSPAFKKETNVIQDQMNNASDIITKGQNELGEFVDGPLGDAARLAQKEYEILQKQQHGLYKKFYPDRYSINTLGTDAESMHSVLLHELQHAIQFRENFGKGGNTNTSISDYKKSLDTQIRELGGSEPVKIADQAKQDLSHLRSIKRIRDNENLKRPRDLFSQMDWYKYSDHIRRELGPQPKRYGPELNEWVKKGGQWLARKESMDLQNKYGLAEGFYDKFKNIPIKKFNNAVRRAEYKANKLNTEDVVKIRGLGFELENVGNVLNNRSDLIPDWKSYDSYDIYRRLAGEVEARNVQARRGMTKEQRKENPPWKTRDVSEEGIILKGTTGPVSLGLLDADEGQRSTGRLRNNAIYDGLLAREEDIARRRALLPTSQLYSGGLI
tara:strand:- start:1290 stop:3164 length:1875 start_codon:yes stop_codon:yes gene_type:complete